MRINTLALKNYRNCLDVELDFRSDKTLIIGKNAQGKTNILESIFFLSQLNSPRISNVRDLINFDANNMSIKAELNKSDTDILMEYIVEDDKKVYKLNGLKTTTKNFKNVLKTVLFSTEDLSLLRGAPQDRRNWLDRAITQIYPAYSERLKKYDKIRIQKNNLLKMCSVDENLLDIFNSQLVITGANIILLRQKFLKELNEQAVPKYSMIANNENFSMRYSVEYSSMDEIVSYLTELFNNSKQEEIIRKQSCYGPHRDDIYFYINGQNATKYASQGQQRTVVLSLKLGELSLIKEKLGEYPVLLLDDVLAELDDIRQNYLLKSIENNIQTIITSVDTVLFDEDFLSDVQILKIQQGQVV